MFDLEVTAAVGRALLGTVVWLDGLEVEIAVGKPARHCAYRWERGRFHLATGRASARGHRDDDAAPAYQVLAPARYLPAFLQSVHREADGLLTARCGPQGAGSVWTLDPRRRVLVEAHPDPADAGGQAMRLVRLWGSEALDDWSDDVAAAIGSALAVQRSAQEAPRRAWGYPVEGGALTAVLRALVDGEVVASRSPQPVPPTARAGLAARCGDRIVWTTQVVGDRLGVLFRDDGASRYLGAALAGAVIDTSSGLVTHAVDGPNAGGRWWVESYERPGVPPEA